MLSIHVFMVLVPNDHVRSEGGKGRGGERREEECMWVGWQEDEERVCGCEGSVFSSKAELRSWRR